MAAYGKCKCDLTPVDTSLFRPMEVGFTGTQALQMYATSDGSWIAIQTVTKSHECEIKSYL